nr:putative integron gene cassette protein [uncultured bacterium]
MIATVIHQLRLALLFGRFLGTSLLRSCPLSALALRMRRVAGFGNGDRLSVSLPPPDAVASDTSRKVRGARPDLTASTFGTICRAHVLPASSAA